jgi:hypothetical protein
MDVKIEDGSGQGQFTQRKRSAIAEPAMPPHCGSLEFPA